MDSDNFNGQLSINFNNNEKILYKANNVSIALEILLNNNQIDRNTLVVFDLDGTLFISNADDVNRRDTLLPEIRDTFLPVYRRLRGVTEHTGIITGRSDNKRQITEQSLRELNLEFNSGMIYFSGGFKFPQLSEMLRKIGSITRVIYFDDVLLHNGVYGTIQPILDTFPNIKFIGVKVGDEPEMIFDVEEQFTQQNTANLAINGDRIISTVPVSVPRYVPPVSGTHSHTSALTDEEEATRIAEAIAISQSIKVKYLKYKAKYLQLKKYKNSN